MKWPRLRRAKPSGRSGKRLYESARRGGTWPPRIWSSVTSPAAAGDRTSRISCNFNCAKG
eukprot:5206056-Pleurochrysis_carterae.AAC.1